MCLYRNTIRTCSILFLLLSVPIYMHYKLCIYVQVLIPVSGKRSAGQLRSTAIFRDGQWHLTHLVLEFNGRTEKLIIIDNRK